MANVYYSIFPAPNLYAMPNNRFVEFVLIVPPLTKGMLPVLTSPGLFLISIVMNNLSLTGNPAPGPVVSPESILLEVLVPSAFDLGNLLTASVTKVCFRALIYVKVWRISHVFPDFPIFEQTKFKSLKNPLSC